MKRILLSPKWLAGHVLVIAIALGMLRLGLWQWHRAESSHGGIQNFAYAFQWPCFAAFGIVLWVKTIRIELDDEDEPRLQPSRFAAKPLPEPEIRKRPGVRIGISTQAVEPDDDDTEVKAYNAYLARLNARTQPASRRGA